MGQTCASGWVKLSAIEQASVESLENLENLESDDHHSFEVNLTAREKILEWKYQVIDHFNMDRKTVALSVKLLDRYLANCKNSNELEQQDAYYTKKGFQLAAMVTLFIAIKVQEPKKLKISSLIELSRGYFTVEEFYKAEQRIIKNLNYRINFPLESDYVSRFTVLLGSVDFLSEPSNDLGLHHVMYEYARYLTELSQIDSFFLPYSSAKVAFAAFVNAMERGSYRIRQNRKMRTASLDHDTRSKFYEKAGAEFGLIYNSQEIVDLRNRLNLLINSTSH